jgi:hypothetical protein
MMQSSEDVFASFTHSAIKLLSQPYCPETGDAKFESSFVPAGDTRYTRIPKALNFVQLCEYPFPAI